MDWMVVRAAIALTQDMTCWWKDVLVDDERRRQNRLEREVHDPVQCPAWRYRCRVGVDLASRDRPD